MQSTQFGRGLALLAAALVLLVGLAGCGGDEPAPVAAPPAPPPAPPPFQPQAVEVALGESGGSLTLMTTEAGGFTLDGEAVDSGYEHPAENGNVYVLTIADGAVAAAYQPVERTVELGASGSVTLVRAEDGSWAADGEGIADGGLRTVGGNTYVLTLGADGAWTAAYQPHMVSVGLGLAGMLELTRAEDGSWWDGDAAVASGYRKSVAVGDRTNAYALTLGADGAWTAAYQPHMVSVGLGLADPLELTRAEDGSWWDGDAAVASGYRKSVAVGDRTNAYALTLGADGAWTAAYQPHMVSVGLGLAGMLELTRAEDGSWWDGDMAVASGYRKSVAVGDRTNAYALTLGADGAWTAAYQPHMVSVDLGLADPLELTRAEDGSWWDGDAAVASGYQKIVAVGTHENAYTLTLDAAGEWSASFNGDSQTVQLGLSGSVTLERAEDGSWSIAGTPVASGATYMAENGNAYILELLAGNVWQSTYSPRTLAIANTDFTAMAKEDGSGYTVGEVGELAMDGSGSLDADGALYRVWQDAEGSLQGLRYDLAIGRSTDNASGTDKSRVGLAKPELGGDNEDTPQDEAGSELTVGGGLSLALGDLLAGGIASEDGKGLVATAEEAIEKQRAVVVALQAAEEADDSAIGDSLYQAAWDAVGAAIDGLFGAGNVSIGAKPRNSRMLGEIDAILEFLASEDGFAAGTDSDGDYENSQAGWDEDAARALFNAIEKRETVRFGFTESTRFGARTLEESDAADPSELNATAHNVFAYSALKQTLRVRDLPQTGVAVYEGRTVAVDDEAEFYEGAIELQLRIASFKISGTVSGLVGDDGSPWVHNGSDVERIYLPTETFGSNRTSASAPKWTSGTGAQDASVTYSNPGARGRLSEVAAYWQGELLGRGGDAGTAAIGSWSLSESAVADGSTAFEDDFLIRGAFGAERTAIAEEQVPESDPEEVETWVASVTLGDLSSSDAETAFGDLVRLTSGMEPEVSNYSGTAAGLFESGKQTFKQEGFGIAFRKVLEKQLDVLESVLAAEEAGADLMKTKEDIWATITDEAAKLFLSGDLRITSTTEPNSVAAIFGAAYPGRDQDAISLIEGAIEALQDKDSFVEAVDPDGEGAFGSPYHDDDGDPISNLLVGGISGFLVGGDAWDNSPLEIVARYDAVSYTHFGAWYRKTAPNAYTADTHPPTANFPIGVFAYSPLASARIDYDDVAGLTATYEGGAWLAEYLRDENEAIGLPNLYQAVAEVIVTWGADQTAGGTFVLALSDIADGNGDFLNQPGQIPGHPGISGYTGEVSGILISGEIAVDATSGEASTTHLDAASLTVALTNAATLAQTAKVDFSKGSVDMRFVADSSDGPLGVIGRFALEEIIRRDDTGYYLQGAFGAVVP